MCHCLRGASFRSYLHFFEHLTPTKPFPGRLWISTSIMSYRPNFQGGRRGASSSSGRGGGRRGGGRGGGGGLGEQRWWDPVWRAERLRQQQAEVFTRDLWYSNRREILQLRYIGPLNLLFLYIHLKKERFWVATVWCLWWSSKLLRKYSFCWSDTVTVIAWWLLQRFNIVYHIHRVNHLGFKFILKCRKKYWMRMNGGKK